MFLKFHSKIPFQKSYSENIILFYKRHYRIYFIKSKSYVSKNFQNRKSRNQGYNIVRVQIQIEGVQEAKAQKFICCEVSFNRKFNISIDSFEQI